MRTIHGLLVTAVVASLAAGCSPVTTESGTFGPSSPAVRPAYILKVVDGDTAHLLVEGRREKVRFIGVDAPESTREAEPWGSESSDYAKSVLMDRRVWIETDVEDRDRYGRLLAYVWLDRPESRADEEVRDKQFNARLLLTGNAVVLTVVPNVRYAEAFVGYQGEAREAEQGLWRGLR